MDAEAFRPSQDDRSNSLIIDLDALSYSEDDDGLTQPQPMDMEDDVNSPDINSTFRHLQVSQPRRVFSLF